VLISGAPEGLAVPSTCDTGRVTVKRQYYLQTNSVYRMIKMKLNVIEGKKFFFKHFYENLPFIAFEYQFLL
jgi:hypothetical protein